MEATLETAVRDKLQGWTETGSFFRPVLSRVVAYLLVPHRWFGWSGVGMAPAKKVLPEADSSAAPA